jgi:6-phospho-3-hexuloisomerase
MDLRDWFEVDIEEVRGLIHGIAPVGEGHLGEELLAAGRVFVAGQGRSGLILRMFAMRLMQMGVGVYIVGDTLTPAIRIGDLLLAASASGETGGVVRAAQRAREAGARVAAITILNESTLAKLSQHLTIIPGETPKLAGAIHSRLPLASAWEQALLVYLECLEAWLASQKGLSNEEMMARHANLE